MAELNPKENQENKPSGTPASGQPVEGGQAQTPSGSQASGLTRRRTPPPSSLAAGGNPFALMRQFADEMDRVFENFGFGRSRFGLPSLLEEFPWTGTPSALSQSVAWSPQVEVFEQGGRLVVRADVPGLKKEDLKVEFKDDALVIQGERKQEREDKREGFYHSERSYGSFYRAIPLPEGSSAEGATASFKDGVLEVSLPAPRRDEKRGRSIQVQ